MNRKRMTGIVALVVLGTGMGYGAWLYTHRPAPARDVQDEIAREAAVPKALQERNTGPAPLAFVLSRRAEQPAQPVPTSKNEPDPLPDYAQELLSMYRATEDTGGPTAENGWEDLKRRALEGETVKDTMTRLLADERIIPFSADVFYGCREYLAGGPESFWLRVGRLWGSTVGRKPDAEIVAYCRGVMHPQGTAVPDFTQGDYEISVNPEGVEEALGLKGQEVVPVEGGK